MPYYRSLVMVRELTLRTGVERDGDPRRRAQVPENLHALLAEACL